MLFSTMVVTPNGLCKNSQAVDLTRMRTTLAKRTPPHAAAPAAPLHACRGSAAPPAAAPVVAVVACGARSSPACLVLLRVRGAFFLTI